MLQIPRLIEKSQEKRAYRRTLSIFVPSKSCYDAVAVPLVFNLQHHALVSLISAGDILRHYSIETGTFKTPEPVGSNSPSISCGLYINRRRCRRQKTSKPLPSSSKRLAPKIPISFTEK